MIAIKSKELIDQLVVLHNIFITNEIQIKNPEHIKYSG